MKKITLLSILILLTSFQLQAQKLKGNKNITIENREVGSFTSILLTGKIEVILQESPMNKVRVETDENLQVAVETRVVNEVLEVYLSQEIKSKKTLNITIGVTDSIRRIEAHDKAEITSDNEIHTINTEIVALDNASIQLKLRSKSITVIGEDKSDLDLVLHVKDSLNIILNTKSHLKLESKAYKINIDISDGASLKYEGICKEISINSKGNTNIRGKDLLTDYAYIRAIGRSNIVVNAAKELRLYSDGSITTSLYDKPKIYIEKFEGKSILKNK